VGPPDALHDLIHASVAGRSQPLRKRTMFPAEDDPVRSASNWSFISPSAVHDLLTSAGWASDADPVALRGLVLNLLRGLTISGDITDGDDILGVQFHLERSLLLARLGHALAPVPPALLRRLPDDLDVAAALSIGSFEELLQIGKDLAEHGLGPLAALGLEPDTLGSLLTHVIDALQGVDGVRPREALSGEVLAVRLPPPPGPIGADTSRWVLAMRVKDEAVADHYFEHALTNLLGADWTYGALHDAGTAPPLHMVREARRWSEPEGTGTIPPHTFVWRVTDGLLVIAANESLLDEFGPSIPGPFIGPTQVARQRALRSLRRDSPVIVLASPQRLSTVFDSPWSNVLFAPLAEGFHAAATLDVDASTVRLRTNLGVWTAVVALTSTDRLTVDSLMLSDLSPECVRAYMALCASRDVGPLCEAFQPGRKAALAGICGRLDP
jgi:hypothetical protein